MTIVEQSGGQYHVLLIIADGQVLHLICDNFCYGSILLYSIVEIFEELGWAWVVVS